MTFFELFQIAQATAAKAVHENLSAFATAKAALDAFIASGCPETDWRAFNEVFTREVQVYRRAIQRDKKTVVGTEAPINPPIPEAILKNLPEEVRARLTGPLTSPGDKELSSVPDTVQNGS